MNSLRITPKTDKESLHLDTPNRSPLLLKEAKVKCPQCQTLSQLCCYGCCYQLACEECFDSDHFILCGRQFNKIRVAVGSGNFEQNKSKNNRKNNATKYKQKCRRCEQMVEVLEYCQQCKVSICLDCSNTVHSKGKFMAHVRTVSESPQKLKRIDTIHTQNCQLDQSMRKEKKESYEHQEYGFKAKERSSKIEGRMSKQISGTSSTTNRKGRSVAKVPFDNQENTPFRHKRKNSMIDQDQSCRNDKDVSKTEPSWLICGVHSKKRSILTENFDLVCVDCFESIKNSVGKIKVVELEGWLVSQVERETVEASVEATEKYARMKVREIGEEFGRYREELEKEYLRKREMLEERYQINVGNVDKWEKILMSHLTSISSKCQLFTKNNVAKPNENTDSTQKDIQKIGKLRSLILFEEISKGRKDFSQQIDQYHFKTSQINASQFQDMLKSYSFLRKKVDIDGNYPKNVSKISQSAQLRQSRISNTSMTTDRKVPRNDSMVKSTYYQLSHGHAHLRSGSKDVKEDLTKDISQRVLFPVNNGKSDRKQSKLGLDSKRSSKNKSNYFFESTPQQQEEHKNSKDSQTPSLGLKDVKYINLQTVINQKMEKSQVGPKKQSLQLSTPAVLDHQNSVYISEITEVLTEMRDESQKQVPKPYMLSDTRLTQSINMGQAGLMASVGERPTVPSVNSSMQAVKNKRKSDYMEMRDRLRKPSGVFKIGK